MEKEKLQKFVNYGNELPDDAVGLATGGQVLTSVLGVTLSYNKTIGIVSVLPCILLTIVFYLIYKYIKKDKKIFNLFFGIQSLMVAITIQVIGFVISPIKTNEIKTLLILAIIADIFVIALVIFIAQVMIKSKKIPTAATATAIAPFAAIGVMISRIINIESINGIRILFILLGSLFFFFFIYVLKYHYANVLEKGVEK